MVFSSFASQLSPVLLAVAFLVTSAVPVSAQQPSEEPTFRAESLADGNYAERQRATLEMWRKRTDSRQAVQRASRNADPEVAERAEWILRQWRNGTLPGTERMAIGSLMQSNDPSTLADVLEDGFFAAVLVAVEESAGTIEFQQIKGRVARFLTERFPMYVGRATEDGTEGDLLRLIAAVSTDQNLAQSYRDLSTELGQELEPNALPRSAEVWSDVQKSQFLAQLATLRGDDAEAVEHARRTGDPLLVRIAQMLGGRWQDLVEDSLAEAESAASVPLQVDLETWALAGAYRSDSKRIDEIVERLTSQTAHNEASRLLAWHSLAIHGRLDDAIDVLAESDPAVAANVAITASRLDRALELIEYPIHEIDSRLDEWIDDAFQAQALRNPGELAPEIARLASLARLLLHVGDLEHPYEIYRRLAVSGIVVGRGNESLLEWTLARLQETNRIHWLIEFAVGPKDTSLTRNSLREVAWALNVDDGTIVLLTDRMKMILPQSTYQRRFRAACHLLLGDVPEGFRPEQDFRRLFDLLANQQGVSQLRGRTFQSTMVALDFDVIDMFASHGEVALAREGLQMLARSTRPSSLDAMIRWAQLETEQGNAVEASRLWEEAADRATESTRTQAFVTTDHGLAYAKAMVGKWVLARRAGHRETAEDLERRIRLTLCSPSLRLRKGLADYLHELKQHRLAATALRDLVVQSSYGGDRAPDFFFVARSYVLAVAELAESDPMALAELQIDPRDVADWSDLSLMGILDNDRFPVRYFVSLPLSVRKAFLQYAIDQKDESAASEAIAAIEHYDLLNIDFAERMLPELRKAGFVQLADTAFDRLMDHGIQHTERFGLDSTALNNLAWAAAMNERRLSEALPLSQRAVDLEPDSVVYRDTLAEVLHLTGQTREALAIESACLLDEPDEWHLHTQIKKYRAVLRDQ